MSNPSEHELLPGGELVAQGIVDLEHDHQTHFAFLVLAAAPRLRRLGVRIPERPWVRPEHQLYALLEQRHGPGAHSHYNTLLRRIVSYARALEREQSATSATKR